MKQFEKLWPYPQEINFSGEFIKRTKVYLNAEEYLPDMMSDLSSIGGLEVLQNDVGFPIEITLDSAFASKEEYCLEMNESGISIKASDRAGLMYGFQTLLQIFVIYRKSDNWPIVIINDHPSYKKRCFMADMGRSVFSMPMLKRLVRILYRLKMNQLHLHLYDDELCGIRFDGLPFGTENPHSISIEDLGELVKYAAYYGVEIVPELEGWAHVGSIVYHRPDLRGGEGMYDGSSFLICEEMFKLMEEFIRQVASVMPKQATIHLGLDEAKWFPDKSIPEGFSPTDMVGRYHAILQQIAKETDKELTLRVWADHGGRAMPEEALETSIIEPWQYWNMNKDMIDKQISRYSGDGKMRWMMGAGQSGNQFRGSYYATRYWCKSALDSPNVDGVNITFWMSNNLDRNLISLFAGALFAWNPLSPVEAVHSEDYEAFDNAVFTIMHWWQSNFRDAFQDDIVKDRGPEVFVGFYMWGDKHGQSVAPTAPIANTLYGHDFLNEGRE